MKLSTGWVVVCPDGHVRHLPYQVHRDALCDGAVFSYRGCTVYATPNAWERSLPACPCGVHIVRPVIFAEPAQSEYPVA